MKEEWLMVVKILLDTNIIIDREMKHPNNEEIGKLYWWIDKLHYEKCISKVSYQEIFKMQDKRNRESFLIKLKSYTILQTMPPITGKIKDIYTLDKTDNDRADTMILNELLSGRVDFLITEDEGIHRKAEMLNIHDRVFTIDRFLDEVTSENPDLLEYKVQILKKEYFGNIDLADPFFDSFKEDYKDYEKWFNKKANDFAYVARFDGKIAAFLYIKKEDELESYSDITPIFQPKKRLKIGAFKVQRNGFRLGERLLKVAFDNALNFNVQELYVTIFPKRDDQIRLINLLKDYGFYYYGIKKSSSGDEQVYVRDFSRKVSTSNTKSTYPFMSKKARKFIVPIKEEYHTSLFPDSILRTESPENFEEHEPFRNAISKAYISRSLERDLNSGDIIIFYRTGGYYRSVITTLGIVENVYINIQDFEHFFMLCRKRTVFSEQELRKLWDSSPANRPFIVNFLYAYSFPRRLNLKDLIKLGIIKDIYSAPRSFTQIANDLFEIIIRETGTNENIIVD
jgi:predicted nucleic acid-binding protein